MADGNIGNLADLRAKAREEAYAAPLESLNPAQPELFEADAMWPIFARLRAEDPVHYTAEHEFGPYWSICKYNDIMAIDTNHQQFSSDFMKGGITIAGGQADMDPLPMFIAMDPPKHDVQRKTLATLFDMPQEDRRQLIYWSDVVTAVPGQGLIETFEQKMQIFVEYHAYFTELWNQRINAPPKGDLISMLGHGEA